MGIHTQGTGKIRHVFGGVDKNQSGTRILCLKLGSPRRKRRPAVGGRRGRETRAEHVGWRVYEIRAEQGVGNLELRRWTK